MVTHHGGVEYAQQQLQSLITVLLVIWSEGCFLLHRATLSNLSVQRQGHGIQSGFPIWFLTHDQRGPFCDILPAPRICKSFFQSAIGFSLAQGVSLTIWVPNAHFLPDEKTPPLRHRCADTDKSRTPTNARTEHGRDLFMDADESGP